MKRLIFLLAVVTNILNASWEEDWSNGVHCCVNQDYVSAEENFNKAIVQLEFDKDISHPHVYVDRGRLYSFLGRDTEALLDLNIARESPFLHGDDKLRAVVTRLITYYRLNMIEESKVELEVFKSIYSCPKLEVYKDTVIIRNIPDCECTKNLLKAFVATSFCDSEDDVNISNGICIGKRKVCNCVSDEDKNDQKEDRLEDKNESVKIFHKASQSSISDCKWYCDKMQVAGNIFCAGTFKFFRCQAVCIATVELIKDGCYWCCDSGNMYKKCVKPFEDIVGHMGRGCDPAWD